MSTLIKKRLVELAAWAASEDAKRQLGLPSEWDQSGWLTRRADLDCGTACCIAGKVTLEDGGVPVMHLGAGSWTDRWLTDVREGTSATYVQFPSGRRVTAEDYAQEALGLTDRQAMLLFNGDNELDDIIRVVAELIAD